MKEPSPQFVIQCVRQIRVTEVVYSGGAGVEDDPYRVVTQWWTLDGHKLGENDPYASTAGPPVPEPEKCECGCFKPAPTYPCGACGRVADSASCEEKK